MGITVCVEDGDGNELDRIEDPTNVLHRVLPSLDDPEYQHANMIDWYGDTVFNPVQASRLLHDWRRLAAKAAGGRECAVVEGIQAMAERVSKGVHVYLKFYGD